jgi:signal transduction histidine kinase
MIGEDGEFFCVAHACDPSNRDQLSEHCRRRLDLSLILQAANTRQVVKSSDIDWDSLSPEQRCSYETLAVAKFAMEPILREERVLAVLVLMRQHNNPVPQRKAVLLHALLRHISVLIENAQLKQEVRALSILDERRRLANDLHDSATQTLFTLNLTAEGLREALMSERAFARHLPALDMLITQAQKVQTEIRSLVNELRPINLDEEPLGLALRRHGESLRYSTGADVEVSIRGVIDHLPLAVQRHINRIAQEALSNVARHAHAERVRIALNVEDEVVTLTISDDGQGFDPYLAARTTSQSLGLISMRERAEMLAGALVIRSTPESGTNITVTIPVASQD